MDWREMAGRPTVRGMQGQSPYSWAWSGGKKIGYTWREDASSLGRIDPIRGWIIAACWLLASGAEYVWHYPRHFMPEIDETTPAFTICS